MKLWDVYKNDCIETMEHGCDVLAVAFRPDGKEVCAAATNGNIHSWDVEVRKNMLRSLLGHCPDRKFVFRFTKHSYFSLSVSYD